MKRRLALRLAATCSRVLVATCVAAAATGVATPALAAGGWLPTATHAGADSDMKDLGSLPDSSPVRVSVAMKLRNEAELDKFVDRMMSGGIASPMSHEQLVARFEPTRAQAAEVAAYLRSKGFSGVEVSGTHMLVSASGSAAAVKAAFHTELHRFEAHGREGYANVGDAMVPAFLADKVLAVLGLENLQRARVSPRAPTGAKALATPTCQPSATVQCMAQYPAIYGATGLPTASNTSVGIITFLDPSGVQGNVAAFAAASGYPTAPTVTYSPHTFYADTTQFAQADYQEWTMDAEAVLAAAGGQVKSLIVYNSSDSSPQAVSNAYDTAYMENQAKVVTSSLQWCENATIMGTTVATDDQYFKLGMAQGQVFVTASGDHGDFACQNYVAYGPNLAYPGSSPYVVAVGGTELTASGSTWSSEITWGCPNYCLCNGIDKSGTGQNLRQAMSVGATPQFTDPTCSFDPQSQIPGGEGAGFSSIEPAPQWQINSGVLSGHTTRGTPDLALSAAGTDRGAAVYMLYPSGGGNYAWIPNGGTSLASPLFAGFYARIETANANRLASPLGVLYAHGAANPQWFHPLGHSGWSQSGGFGSLQVANFAAGMKKYGSAAAITTIIDSLLLN